MPNLIRCIYSSVASRSFTEENLPDILTQARCANAKRGVTGMLAYANGNFLQVIEGDAVSVDELLEKLKADGRHKRLMILAREPIQERSFAEWSMGFEALLPADLDAIVGENDFFDTGSCLSALNPGIVKSVLLSFRCAQAQAIASAEM